ncbi:DNA-binding PadR family transcriptional regulator [Lipingzhangella halophila]|uniref:DNA-binding PadR family transcriptional regulator n=1 Tax=Lipingzhangella halophila TaxID=1783352 RepID=A0A7W7RDG4_9ACTN|nr:PadR family transcriptional regulator [Lipingzhangella halophila]MBB4929958.1 DNA-binding PadR family transcriptional regulator [Lipingzhangella halophila]
MSTIFGHGRLRLYLLKLLDESPRHGYEIISLLRDRFLGVYSPSPGTIYPRLARLEEEGLVTHEEVNGRKVYRLTDKGREELQNRASDLDDLEREITDSVRDVARAVKEDVRDTISSLREELKFASGEGRRSARREEGAASDSEESTGEDSEEQRREDARGSWWERDWEKLAQGLGGAWGGAWSRRERGAERPEFEQALRDFSERVRGVVREAGNVGESATHDLRRVLDDTLEVIRRDLAKWGPPERTAQDEEEREDKTGGAARSSGAGAASGTEGEDTTAKSGTAEGPSADPGAPTAEGGGAPETGDPWSTAIQEEQGKETGDGTGSDGSGSGSGEQR